MNYNLVMITPFVNRDNVEEFLTSITRNKSLKLLVVLIDMSLSVEDLNFSGFDEKLINFVYLRQDIKYGLSKARNIALKFLFNESNFDFEYLMFPDDDTTFDNSFFLNFKYIVTGPGVFIDTKCKGTDTRYITNKIKESFVLSKKKQFKYIGSVSFVFSKKLIERIGYFDERLGVGAEFGASEDGDYYIRSLEYSNLKYTELLYTFHPAPNIKYSRMSLKELTKRFVNYSKGGMFLLCKHKMYIEAIIMISRGLLGSIVCFFKLNFKLSIVYLIAFFARLKYFFILLNIYKENNNIKTNIR